MKTRKIVSVILCAAIILSLIGCAAVSAAFDYRKAVRLAEKGEEEKAYTIFSELGDYKDSAEKLQRLGYKLAKTAIDEEEYETAAGYLEPLGDYKNSEKLLRQCNYQIAGQVLAEGDYDRAAELFNDLGDYEDAMEMTLECQYMKAMSLFEEKNYTQAREIFIILGEYKDSLRYENACGLLDDPDRYIDLFMNGLNTRLLLADAPFRFEETEPKNGSCRHFSAYSDNDKLGFDFGIEFRHMGRSLASYSNKVINDVHIYGEMGKYNDQTHATMLAMVIITASLVNCEMADIDDIGDMTQNVSLLYADGIGPNGPIMGNILQGTAEMRGFALSYSLMTDKTLSSVNYDIFIPELMDMR